jgi:hypothetical protein
MTYRLHGDSFGNFPRRIGKYGMRGGKHSANSTNTKLVIKYIEELLKVNIKKMAVRSALTLTVLMIGALANAETYHVTLLKPSLIAGKELKPGDYTVEVNNDRAVISHGKQSVETKVKTETSDRKYSSTTVRYEMQGEKYKVQEIGIGGTHTKLVVTGDGTAAGAL